MKAVKGDERALTLQLSFDREGLQMQQDFVIRPRLNFPMAIVRSRIAIVFIRPTGAGEDATGRSRHR